MGSTGAQSIFSTTVKGQSGQDEYTYIFYLKDYIKEYALRFWADVNNADQLTAEGQQHYTNILNKISTLYGPRVQGTTLSPEQDKNDSAIEHIGGPNAVNNFKNQLSAVSKQLEGLKEVAKNEVFNYAKGLNLISDPFMVDATTNQPIYQKYVNDIVKTLKGTVKEKEDITNAVLEDLNKIGSDKNTKGKWITENPTEAKQKAYIVSIIQKVSGQMQTTAKEEAEASKILNPGALTKAEANLLQSSKESVLKNAEEAVKGIDGISNFTFNGFGGRIMENPTASPVNESLKQAIARKIQKLREAETGTTLVFSYTSSIPAKENMEGDTSNFTITDKGKKLMADKAKEVANTVIETINKDSSKATLVVKQGNVRYKAALAAELPKGNNFKLESTELNGDVITYTATITIGIHTASKMALTRDKIWNGVKKAATTGVKAAAIGAGVALGAGLAAGKSAYRPWTY